MRFLLTGRVRPVGLVHLWQAVTRQRRAGWIFDVHRAIVERAFGMGQGVGVSGLILQG